MLRWLSCFFFVFVLNSCLLKIRNFIAKFIMNRLLFFFHLYRIICICIQNNDFILFGVLLNLFIEWNVFCSYFVEINWNDIQFHWGDVKVSRRKYEKYIWETFSKRKFNWNFTRLKLNQWIFFFTLHHSSPSLTVIHFSEVTSQW